MPLVCCISYIFHIYRLRISFSQKTKAFSKELFILFGELLFGISTINTLRCVGPPIIHYYNYLPMLSVLDKVMPGKSSGLAGIGKATRSSGSGNDGIGIGRLNAGSDGIGSGSGSGRLNPRSDGIGSGISIGNGAARNDGTGIGIGKSMGNETPRRLGSGNGIEIEASDAQTAAKTTNRRHCKTKNML